MFVLNIYSVWVNDSVSRKYSKLKRLKPVSSFNENQNKKKWWGSTKKQPNFVWMKHLKGKTGRNSVERGCWISGKINVYSIDALKWTFRVVFRINLFFGHFHNRCKLCEYKNIWINFLCFPIWFFRLRLMDLLATQAIVIALCSEPEIAKRFIK